jgi:predicted cupin superfamily sugar epimerase
MKNMNGKIKLETEVIIKKFGLVPLDGEGGLYYEAYRSEEFIDGKSLPKRYGSERCFYTSIYYLITDKNYSRLHKVKSDEIFHFYLGDPVEMLNLFPDGSFKKIILGQNILKDEKLQHLVPSEVWQGTRLKKGGSFALLGTTVSPGFEFEDFTSAEEYKDEIMQKYDNIKSYIIDYF